MVVTKREFQEIIDQVNIILTKLDERIKKLEEAPKTARTTKTTKSQEKDLTSE